MFQMGLTFVNVYVNNVFLGSVDVEGFFSKYGNNDGNNVIGLIAEAYLIKKLLEKGYKIRIVHSHNVEIREIRKGPLIYECVGEYGEVIEKMPEKLKREFISIIKSGIKIRIGDDGEIPVYFENKLLLKTSLKRELKYLISKQFLSFISPILEDEYEPFHLYLGWEVMFMLFYADSLDMEDGKLVKMFEKGLEHVEVRNVEDLLNETEKILEKAGIFLVKDWWMGLKISNEKTIVKEFKKLNRKLKLE